MPAQEDKQRVAKRDLARSTMTVLGDFKPHDHLDMHFHGFA
jgi:hypothetical protein